MKMDIKGMIKGFDFFVKKICASRSSNPNDISDAGIEMKREIKQSIDVPSEKTDTFSITISDRVHFHPENGPFEIEVVIGSTVFLDHPLEPFKLKNLMKNKKNLNHLINQCLPHSCSTIAHLTDKMGYGPIILSPQYPVGLNNKD